MSRKKRDGKLDNTVRVALIGATATIIVAVITGAFSLLQQRFSAALKPVMTSTVSFLASTPSLSQPSVFNDNDTEGWVLNFGLLTNPGGFLRAVPLNDSQTSYYVAPPRYHGNWMIYNELRLDLSSSGGDYYTSGYSLYGDIYLANGRMTAQRFLSHRPSDAWETFIIPLRDNDKWIFGSGATELNDILIDVTDFQIRAEYGGGPDISGLDNVMLIK